MHTRLVAHRIAPSHPGTDQTAHWVMTEHPGWLPTDFGHQRVFSLADNGRYLVTITNSTVTQRPLRDSGSEPQHDTFALSQELSHELSEAPELAHVLARLGKVTRYCAGNLWDAIGWAIIRVRVGCELRASDVEPARLYRALCDCYGERLNLPTATSHALFPTPDAVMQLDSLDFRRVGLDKASRRPLIAAATAYLEHCAEWHNLPAPELVDALQTVPRIGPSTARMAIADWTNNWALYPYTNTALRTCAMKAAPTKQWPNDGHEFGRNWRLLAGTRQNLSTLTLLTLAWDAQAH